MKTNRPLLNAGDTLGVLPLSSPSEETKFGAGLKFLESLGFATKVMLNPSRAYGNGEFLFSSDTAKNRARALEALFKDRTVKAIISSRGGYGAMEVLEHFDFSVARKHRKPLIGFSDTTTFLVALRQKSGCLTIHGPSVESFANAVEREEVRQSGEALTSLLLDRSWNPTAHWKLERVCGRGSAKGEILGGNLSILAALCGTPWQPRLRNKILFLEEVNEKPYRVHRMLLQLILAGCLHGVRGVLLGGFRNCESDKKDSATLDQALFDLLSRLKVPVWKGVSAGHEPLNYPIPFGLQLEIE